MNINKLTTGLDNSSRTRNDAKPVEPKVNTQTGNSNSTAADQVKLSNGIKGIQQVEAEIRNMPEVDDATVDRIRAAIENGEYKIDYEKLAGKMLSFEDNLN